MGYLNDDEIEKKYRKEVEEILGDTYDSSMWINWIMDLILEAYTDGKNSKEEVDKGKEDEFTLNPNRPRRDNIVDFLNEKFPEGIQVFDTPNIIDDPVTEIYDFQGVYINYCERWGYIDVIGLNIEEWKYILKNTKCY